MGRVSNSIDVDERMTRRLIWIQTNKYFWEMNLYTEAMANEKMLVETYWDHMPKKPDAIIQTADGSIYVFKKQKYRKYDHLRDDIQKSKPIGPSWIGGECGFDLR